MVKKLKSISEKKSSSAAAGLLDSALAGSVKDSAQQIWLAGMGAFSKAQEEGGKVFEALVKEGMTLQRKTQGMAEEKISEVTGKMSAMAGNVTSKAGQNWDKLESIFEQRTAKALNKLGVPTAKDVECADQARRRTGCRGGQASASRPRPVRQGGHQGRRQTCRQGRPQGRACQGAGRAGKGTPVKRAARKSAAA
jgi:poly(hydroxyalkanoate) granule-associated protein